MNIMNSIHILTYSVIHFITTLLPCGISGIVIIMLQLKVIIYNTFKYMYVYNSSLFTCYVKLLMMYHKLSITDTCGYHLMVSFTCLTKTMHLLNMVCIKFQK